eukprot:2631226-Pyramimonas_sp.AAC.1
MAIVYQGRSGGGSGGGGGRVCSFGSSASPQGQRGKCRGGHSRSSCNRRGQACSLEGNPGLSRPRALWGNRGKPAGRALRGNQGSLRQRSRSKDHSGKRPCTAVPGDHGNQVAFGGHGAKGRPRLQGSPQCAGQRVQGCRGLSGNQQFPVLRLLIFYEKHGQLPAR